MTNNNSDYTPLPEASITNNIRVVNIEEFEEHKREFAKQKSLLNWTHGFILAILIVVLVSYVTFLLDAWKFHYEKIDEFNKIVKSYKQEKDSLMSIKLELRLQNLEKKNFGK